MRIFVFAAVLVGCVSLGSAGDCGLFGQACCNNGKALVCSKHQGACLVFDGNIDGVCSAFGGVFVKNSTACVQPNYFADPQVRTHLTCDCAPGFATVCAPTDDGLSLCTCTSTNLVSDSLYGGMYALDALTHQCATVNPITLQCACPSWTTPAKPIPTQHSTIVICSADKFAMPAPSYGGFWTSSNTSACLSPNPLTGTCGCPADPTDSGLTFCPFSYPLAHSSASDTLTVCHTRQAYGGLEVLMSAPGVESIVVGEVRAVVGVPAVQHFDLGGFHGVYDHIHFDVDDVHLASLSLGDDVSFTFADDEFTFEIDGGSTLVKADHVEGSFIGLKAYCDADITVTKVKVVLAVNASLLTPGGRLYPVVSLRQLVFELGHIKVRISGGNLPDDKIDIVIAFLEWLLPNLFRANLAPVLAPIIQQQLQKLTGLAALQLSPFFNFTLGPYAFAFDASLVGCEIAIASAGLAARVQGVPYLLAPPAPAYEYRPAPASRVPLPHRIPGMAGAVLSPALLEALALTLFQVGAGNFNISQYTTKDNRTVGLMVRDLALFIPEAARMYPAAPMLLAIQTSPSAPYAIAPVFDIDATGINLNMTIGLSLYALTNDTSHGNASQCVSSTPAPNQPLSKFTCNMLLFSLAVYTTIEPVFANDTTSWTATIHFDLAELELALEQSLVGPVDERIVAGLNMLINGFLEIISANLNRALDRIALHIPKDTTFLTITNMQSETGNEYVSVALDYIFHPQL